MIGRQELLEFARDVGLNPNVVEKDYVLGWMLAGIGHHPRTRETWLFKGGTCLKKCYFETYRFSEDLDFTLRGGEHIDEQVLRELFAEITAWVYDESGVEFPENTRAFEVYDNPRGKKSAQGRVGYRGPTQRQGDLPRIRLDLTDDERVVLEPVRQRVHHPYTDEPEGGIHVISYPFEEVFAEKLRALAERERPRDLYDVVHLYRREADVDRASVRATLAAKCEFKGIPVPTPASLRGSPQHDELRADWNQMLAHQLAELPPFESFWDELPAMFAWLEREEAKPRRPAMGALRADLDATWRMPAMAHAWHSEGIGAPLEAIRFAAANRLCIELEYRDEKGRAGSRVIEPYSLRRTKAGELLLYAVRSEDGQDRSYRVDRILGARVTRQTFSPRYEVELSLAGPVHAPEISRPAPARSATPLRAPRQSASRTSVFGQPKYVFRCPVCEKKFERSEYDSALRPHKGKHGYPCPGRTGYYETTKY